MAWPRDGRSLVKKKKIPSAKERPASVIPITPPVTPIAAAPTPPAPGTTRQESLIEKLAKLVPEQLRSVVGEYEKFRLDLPESPLSVTTIVMEYENGTLVPMVSG